MVLSGLSKAFTKHTSALTSQLMRTRRAKGGRTTTVISTYDEWRVESHRLLVIKLSEKYGNMHM